MLLALSVESEVSVMAASPLTACETASWELPTLSISDLNQIPGPALDEPAIFSATL